MLDGLGKLIQFLLSPGNDNDCVYTIELLKKTDIHGSNILVGRAYGAISIRTYIIEKGAVYTIPPQGNVKLSWPVDWWLYKEHHLIECFFQKLKWFRRIATRHDKLDSSFFAAFYLAAISILLL